MSLISLLVLLVVIGVLLYLLNNLVPMDARIKTITNVLVILFVIVYVLKVLGAWQYLARISL